MEPTSQSAAAGEEDAFPEQRKRVVFLMFISTQLVVNYDSGALAAIFADKTENGILAQYSLSQWEQGLLASIVYLGLTLGCACSGPLLMVYRPKSLLQSSLCINLASAWAFAALAQDKVMLMSFRFLVGISQAMLMVYTPVWVDEFAPKKHMSTWMSIIQAGAPVGVTAGYLVSGFLMANTDFDWSWCFYFQCGLLSPLVLGYFFIRNAHLDANIKAKQTAPACSPQGDQYHMCDETPPSAALPVPAPLRTSAESGRGGEPSARRKSKRKKHRKAIRILRRQAIDLVESSGLREVLGNPLVWTTVVSLTFLYFVVTGLQMWVTDYLTSPDAPIQANLNAVIAAFGACAVTGPIAGVLTGGILLDKVGGYRGELGRTCMVATVFAFFAVACAFCSLLVDDLHTFIACIWFLLFFGGGAVPPIQGILITSVRKRLRGLVNSFGGCMYNLMGYFLGPLACGIVAEKTSLVWGFRVVMGCSSISAVFLVLSYFLIRRHLGELRSEMDTVTMQLDNPAETAAGNRERAVSLRAEQAPPMSPPVERVATRRGSLDGGKTPPELSASFLARAYPELTYSQDDIVYSTVRGKAPIFAATPIAKPPAAGVPNDSFGRLSNGSFSGVTTLYRSRPAPEQVDETPAESPECSPSAQAAAAAAPAPHAPAAGGVQV